MISHYINLYYYYLSKKNRSPSEKKCLGKAKKNTTATNGPLCVGSICIHLYPLGPEGSTPASPLYPMTSPIVLAALLHV